MIEIPLSEYLCSNAQLAELLTTYGGEPAIFQQIAPNDEDYGWDTDNHYSRIVFDIDQTADDERKAAGTLYMDIMSTEDSTLPEDIEMLLKRLIDGYFFVQDGMTYSAKWLRTDGFVSEPNNKVFGKQLSFSLLAFPVQITADPDTVELMNNWTAQIFPDAIIINVTETDSVFAPTDEKPVVYWSHQGMSESPLVSNWACTWLQSNLTMHIMAPSASLRNRIIKTALTELETKRRVLWPDKSQFMIHRTLANLASDPVRTGQLIVQGSFGVLRKPSDAQPLAHPHIST